MLVSKAIVLKTIKYSESDLVLQTLRSDGTKLSLFAGGALRSKKRFGGGVLEPTHYLEVHYQASARNKEAELLTLKEAKLIEDFSLLRTSLERLELGLYFLKMLNKVTKESTLDSHGLFDLLGNSLRAAETSQMLSLLRVHFDIKLLALQGEMEPFDGFHFFIRTPVAAHEEIQVEEKQFKLIKNNIEYQLQNFFSDRNLSFPL